MFTKYGVIKSKPAKFVVVRCIVSPHEAVMRSFERLAQDEWWYSHCNAYGLWEPLTPITDMGGVRPSI